MGYQSQEKYILILSYRTVSTVKRSYFPTEKTPTKPRSLEVILSLVPRSIASDFLSKKTVLGTNVIFSMFEKNIFKPKKEIF